MMEDVGRCWSVLACALTARGVVPSVRGPPQLDSGTPVGGGTVRTRWVLTGWRGPARLGSTAGAVAGLNGEGGAMMGAWGYARVGMSMSLARVAGDRHRAAAGDGLGRGHAHRRLTGVLVAVLVASLAVAVAVPEQAHAGDDAPSASMLSTASAEAGATAFEVDGDTWVWRVSDGYDLDQYLYRESSPLDFRISLNLSDDFGPFDAEGFPTAESPLYDSEFRLSLRAYDVDEDQGEVDRVTVNGTLLDGKLTGANNQWKINTFRVPGRLLRLHAPIPQVADNDFEVLIDELNGGWAVEVDWAELRLGTATPLPVMLNHGITGGEDTDSDGCAQTSEEPRSRFRDVLATVHTGVTAAELDGTWLTCPVASMNNTAETNATVLEPVLDHMLEASQAPQVDLVAHSFGGLNSRVLAHRRTNEINSVQMLGTPNAGSPLADVLCTVRLWSDSVLSDFGSCNGWEDSGLYQLRPDYIIDVFNDRYPDLPSVDYRVYGGYKGNALSGRLRGQDDGTVELSSVYWLRPVGTTVRFLGEQDPDHAGLHDPGPVVDQNHSELWATGSLAIEEAVCWLYGCDATASSSTLTAQTTSEPAETPTSIQDVGLALAPGATATVPVDPEDTTTLTITVAADGPVAADFDGTALTPSQAFEDEWLAGTFSASSGTVTVTNTSTVSVDAVVLISGDTSLTLDVHGGGYAPVGSETSVTVAASMPDGTPLDLLVTGPDGTSVAQATATVTAGTASISFTPTTIGMHEVTATTTSPDRSAVGFVTALDPSASIGQATAFGRVDSNGDGLYEQLTVDVPTSMDTEREVRLVAQLVDTDGTHLFGGVIRGLVAAGGATVTIPFDASRLYDLGLGGPFTVESVLLLDHATEQVLAWSDTVGTSPTWDASLWQHDRVRIGDSFTDRGIDTDSDGDFDSLEVSGQVTVDTAAIYAINGRLLSTDGVEIVDFQTETSLAAGTSPLTLMFDGATIGASRIDGPYTVEDVSVYQVSNADALGYRITAHTTQAYTASQFEGGPGESATTPYNALDGGVYHSLATDTDGVVWAWGYNAYGQLGDGTTTNRHAPVAVPGLASSVGIAAGGYHSLAVLSDGTAWAWGRNSSGELGDGSTISSSVPVQVVGLTDVVDVEAGSHHSLAVTGDATVWAWGTNSAGQLGDGTTTARSTPVQVSGLTDVTAVAAGGLSGYAGHNLALRSDGTVWAWGHNNKGQLGDGTTTNRSLTVQVTGLTEVVAVAAGGDSSYALRSDGTVWAWGDNGSGQLANDSVKRASTVPVQSAITQVVHIAAGSEHALAVTQDSTAWSWGNNEYGQLGNGTSGRNASTSTPVQVQGIADVRVLAGGHRHSLGALGDTTTWAWGLNNAGQIGDGTTTTRTTPVPASGLAGIQLT
jgi:YD repeat-containing protein